MLRARTHEEHLIDQLLILSLLEEMNAVSGWQEVMKLMKASFLASWRMYMRRIKGLNLPFWTFDHGPFSKEIYRVLDDSLVAAGLATKQIKPSTSLFHGKHPAPGYTITPKGQAVLSQCGDLFELAPNKQILAEIVAAAQEVAPKDPVVVRTESHEMIIPDPRHPSRQVRIDSLPRNVTLVPLLEPEAVRARFEIDDDWLETLEMVLSPEYEPDAMRRRSTNTYDELLAGSKGFHAELTELFDRILNSRKKKDREISEAAGEARDKILAFPFKSDGWGLHADAKGKRKLYVGRSTYRVLFIACVECRKRNFTKLNGCEFCADMDDSAVVFFAIFPKTGRKDDYTLGIASTRFPDSYRTSEE